MNWQSMCQVSPATQACVLSGGRYKYTKHWGIVDKALLKISLGITKRLIICMPPRYGKSLLVSENFPAWYLGKHPDRNIILASYETEFASSWGYKARRLYSTYAKEIWGSNINKDFAAREWWMTDKGGGMACAGIQAGITGKGAHVFIVDDSIKNSKEARSKLVRDRIWDEYRATATTRLEPDGAIIVMHTRWHHDDLIGRIKKEFPGDYEQIIIPGVDEKGESTFPERFTTERMNQIKKEVGSYFFSALYQQNPTPEEGGMFKRSWIKYYDRLPEKFDNVIQSWDLTFGDTGESFVVGLIIGINGATSYIISMYRGKWDFPNQVKKIKEASTKHPSSSSKLIEKKANGQAAIDTLNGEIAGIIPVVPTESKEARASAISYLIEAGNVMFPTSDREINDVIESDLIPFPDGSTDDFVDSLSQGLTYLHKNTGDYFSWS